MTQCCIITTGHSSVLRSAAMAERPVLDCFSRYIKKKKKQNEGEEEVGMREIITERRMCYPQGLLLIASLTRLWDVLVGYWMWIQLCRLRGVGILAQQTTAQFDINFSFFFFLTINFLLSGSRFSPPEVSPPLIRSGLAVMDWHPLSVKLLYGTLMRRWSWGSFHRRLDRKSNRWRFIIGPAAVSTCF